MSKKLLLWVFHPILKKKRNKETQQQLYEKALLVYMNKWWNKEYFEPKYKREINNLEKEMPTGGFIELNNNHTHKK